MSYLSAILQGLIQGLTEFLPISSSGHLSLFQYFTGVNGEASVSFSILLHLGTLAAVVVAFWPTIWKLVLTALSFLRELFTGKLGKVKASPQRRMLYMLVLSCVPLLIVPFFKEPIASLSSDNSIIAEGVFFLLTALILTLGDRCAKGKKNAATMTPRDAAAVGLGQLVAVLPGISRSGTTISTGLLVGLDRGYAVAYSFILGLPTILAAALLDLKDVLDSGAGFQLEWGPTLAGVLVSAVTGFFAIKLVQLIIKSDKFKIFAIYALVLGIAVIGIGTSEIFTDHAVQHFFTALMAGG